MEKNCKTCKWNFPKQGGSKGRVCANAFYGQEVSDLLKSAVFPCPGWSISFKEFCKRADASEELRR